jgi:Domain of unknown function (DUF4124)
MHRPITTFIYFITMFAVLQSAAFGADLFQWTDASGTIHFTDNPYAVPESIQRSGKLLVRKDFLVNANPIGTVSLPAEPVQPKLNSETRYDSVSDSKQSEPASFTYSPQEINIVVVNQGVRRHKSRACGAGQGCKAGFHPDFNDRRYIHPSVFNGGTRQYIQP